MTSSPLFIECDCNVTTGCAVKVQVWANGSVTLTNTDAPKASIHLSADEARDLGHLLIEASRIESPPSPAERPIGAPPI